VDQIKSQVDNLSQLSDEQIAELQQNIVTEFDSVAGTEPTAESVDAMTSLADMLDSVKSELARRGAAAEELAARAADAAERIKGGENGEGEGEAEGMAPANAEAPMEDEEEMATYGATDATSPMDETAAPETVPAETPVAPATPDNTPAEAPGQVEEGTAVEEATETPEEEDAEKKQVKTAASATSAEASTTVVEGSELSTENTTAEVEETEAAEEPAIVAAAEENPTQETQIAPEAQEEQAPVTAAAEESFQAPADRQPVIQVVEAPVAITAGADIPGYTAGSTINDMSEVASAMEKRIHSLRRVNGGDGEQHIVASITTQYPEARTLTADAESNFAKIQAVSGPEALVASGGWSTPFEVKYDIFAIGSTNERPVRDALPRFQADRGGIRFIVPPSFAGGTYDNAVGVWTAAVDASPGTATKTALTVTAATETTKATDAVSLQLQFGNLATRAYPELIARHNELALVQHAREAEDNLIAGIEAGSTAVTTTNLIGFGRDFLVQVRRAATAYRSRHRLDPQSRLKVIIPFWVYEAMAADLTLAMPGDGTLSVSRAEIDGYLANINVDLVPTLDGSTGNGVFGTQSTGALLEFPDTFKWYIFAEGTFLFLDGGTLDIGIIRDSGLVGTNDYKMFIETFEGVAKVGIESLVVTSTINVNGAAAALRDTLGGVTAAVIEL
jgi:chemotaxis protein histidine kinase CheA